MKLKRVTIKSFRRFTDLAIQRISETSRLIMLAGPNGCGKSSILRRVAYLAWIKVKSWIKLGCRLPCEGIFTEHGEFELA